MDSKGLLRRARSRNASIETLPIHHCPFTWFFLARLTVIEGLEGLTELQELYLSHNVIETAHGLDSQVKLALIRRFSLQRL